MVTQRLLTAEIVLGWTKVGLVLVDDLLRDEFRYSMDFWMAVVQTETAFVNFKKHCPQSFLGNDTFMRQATEKHTNLYKLRSADLRLDKKLELSAVEHDFTLYFDRTVPSALKNDFDIHGNLDYPE